MNNTSTATMSKTKGMAQVALFAALILVMAFTPFLATFRSASRERPLSTFRLSSDRRCLTQKGGGALGLYLTDEFYQ